MVVLWRCCGGFYGGGVIYGGAMFFPMVGLWWWYDGARVDFCCFRVVLSWCYGGEGQTGAMVVLRWWKAGASEVLG